MLALYDQQVWGVVKEYTQDQINAISLLARLELAGVDVGPRWADVADHLALRLADHVLPFLDLQYLYGLARAGRTEAARALLHNITTHAATRTEAHERTVWQQVCIPTAHGLLAHAQGDWATAVEQLGVACPGWWRLAVATRSGICFTRSGWTRCSATASGPPCRTCCSRCATRNRNPHAGQGRRGG